MSADQSVLDAVFFIFRAYGVVIIISFICAAVIWGIVEILNRSQALAEKAKSVPKPVPVSPAVPAGTAPVINMAAPEVEMVSDIEQIGGDIPKDHIAVIAAICAVLEVKPRKIIRVDHSKRFGAWVVGGRNDHMASHRPVRR